MTNPNTGEPVTVPMPGVLEGAERLAAEIANIDESTDTAELSRLVRRLRTELDRSAAYGQMLWHHLEIVATYLRDDVAHASTTGGSGIVLDERQRRRWAEVYSATLSLLAGDRGDSGYGTEQAQWELQNLNN